MIIDPLQGKLNDNVRNPNQTAAAQNIAWVTSWLTGSPFSGNTGQAALTEESLFPNSRASERKNGDSLSPVAAVAG